MASKLAREHRSDLAPSAGKLLKALLAATKKAKSAPIRRDYAAATANVMVAASEVRMRRAAWV